MSGVSVRRTALPVRYRLVSSTSKSELDSPAAIIFERACCAPLSVLSLASPGLAVRGEPVRRGERSLDTRLFPAHPPPYKGSFAVPKTLVWNKRPDINAPDQGPRQGRCGSKEPKERAPRTSVQGGTYAAGAGMHRSGLRPTPEKPVRGPLARLGSGGPSKARPCALLGPPETTRCEGDPLFLRAMAQAQMALGTLAETKVPRLPRRDPANIARR
jgi:hypothetical protein